MNPIDYRNATWDEIQNRIEGNRERVYQALFRHGPMTTRQLATAMDWDILTVRPRVTELFQLGFVVLDRGEGTEGVYRAATYVEARSDFEAKKAAAQPTQLTLI